MREIIGFFLILAAILCIVTIIVVCAELSKKKDNDIVYTLEGKPVKLKKEPAKPAVAPAPAPAPVQNVPIRIVPVYRQQVAPNTQPVTVNYDTQTKTVEGAAAAPKVQVNFVKADGTVTTVTSTPKPVAQGNETKK